MSDEGAGLIRRFEDIDIGSRRSVGGKGASLGELTRAGIRVPPGFVVTTDAFEAFVGRIDPERRIRRTVEGLSPDDLVTVSQVTKGIRDRIETAPIGAALAAAIEAHYVRLCGPDADAPVAVRSSATSEDSTDASFAGLQDTYLWIRGSADVLRFVRSCWASLYSAESVTYRLRRKLPEDGLAMAVVIQAMVNSRVSGVMFTRSPLTGDRSVIAIEASFGLGSCIVSGEVTPDKYVVGKVTGEIVRRTVSHKTVMHIPDLARGGIREQPIPSDRRDQPCLSDDEVLELGRIAKRIEQHYGAAQDIEWAIGPGSDGHEAIFLLQSRPETIWSAREAQPAARPKARAFDHVFEVLGQRGKA